MKQDPDVTAWFIAHPPGRQIELRKARLLKHMLDWGDFGEDREAEFTEDFYQLTGVPRSWHDVERLTDDELMTLRYVSQPFGH